MNAIESGVQEVIACRAGESVEVFLYREDKDEISHTGGALQSALRCARTGASIRTRDAAGMSGEAWTEDLSVAGLRQAREEARAISQHAGHLIAPFPGASSQPGPAAPAAPGEADSHPALDTHIDFITRVAQEAAGRREIRSAPSAWLVNSRQVISLTTSEGYTGSQACSDSHVTVLLSFDEQDGQGSASAFGLSRGRSAHELDGTAAIAEAVDNARAIRSRRGMTACTSDMIIQPSAMAYLVSRFTEFFAADFPGRGRGSCYTPGERVGSQAVTLIDDPRLASGPAWSAFDAEGSPSRTRKLLTNGLVNELLTGRDSGSGGSAFRDDHRSELELRVSNGYLEASHHTPESLVALSPDAVWVQAAHGFPPLGSPVDQNLSLVFEGWQLAGGERVHAVHGTLSSTFTDLMQRVVAVADDGRFFPTAGPAAGSTVLVRDQEFGGV
jgi:predicted Zn-dependent protease